MWTDEVTIATHANREQIWQLWSNADTWAEWDGDVQFAQMHGVFKVGQIGVLKPKGAPKSSFTLREVTVNHSFSTCSRLPLAAMKFVHQLSENDGKLFITHRIEISGASAFVFSRLIGRKWIKTLPHTLQRLSTMAVNLK